MKTKFSRKNYFYPFILLGCSLWAAPHFSFGAFHLHKAPEETYPNWSGQIQFSYEAQSNGRVFTDLSITGNDNLSESGSYLSLGATGGSQILYGSTIAYAGASVGAGAGLGDFLPSLTLTFVGGD